MKNLSQLAGGLGSLAIFLLLGVVEIRGCTVGVWHSPKEPQLFRVHGGDNRTMAILVLPENHVVMTYSDPAKGHLEAVSTIWRGTDSDHYIGPIWHTDFGGLMGWRLFPNGLEPYSMEIEVKDKFLTSKGDSSFRDIGDKTTGIIGFGKDSLYFQGMTLKRTELDPDILTVLTGCFTEQETVQALQNAAKQLRPAA